MISGQNVTVYDGWFRIVTDEERTAIEYGRSVAPKFKYKILLEKPIYDATPPTTTVKERQERQARQEKWVDVFARFNSKHSLSAVEWEAYFHSPEKSAPVPDEKRMMKNARKYELRGEIRDLWMATMAKEHLEVKEHIEVKELVREPSIRTSKLSELVSVVDQIVVARPKLATEFRLTVTSKLTSAPKWGKTAK